MAHYKGCLFGYPNLKKNRASPKEIRDRQIVGCLLPLIDKLKVTTEPLHLPLIV
jgi:hypothetical protein